MTFPAKDTIAGYGGVLNDYAAVVDPTTDRPAAGSNQAYGTAAAMTHNAAKAFARVVLAASTGALALASSNGHDAAWGSSAPVVPTLVRTALGVFTITWPATITDEIGATQSVFFRYAQGTVEGASAYLLTSSVTAANVVTLYAWTTAGAASDLVGVTINLTVY